MLAAGKLRHYVTIQKLTTTQDPVTGNITESWADKWVNVPAAISPLSGREFIAAQSTQSEVTGRITIRWRDGLDASMRIVHTVKGTARIYNIEAILADADSGLEYLTLMVSSGVNDG